MGLIKGDTRSFDYGSHVILGLLYGMPLPSKSSAERGFRV